MRPSGGPSGGGAFVAHAPKSSPSPPPPPPLIGGRTARAVEGSDRCGGTDGLGSSSSFSGGPSGGGAFVAHAPKSSPSPPPPPPLVGGPAARAVEGSGRCGGTDGTGSSSSFSGAGVGAQETRGVSDWGAAHEEGTIHNAKGKHAQLARRTHGPRERFLGGEEHQTNKHSSGDGDGGWDGRDGALTMEKEGWQAMERSRTQVRIRCDDGAQRCCRRTPCSRGNALAIVRNVSTSSTASDALTFSGVSRRTRAPDTHRVLSDAWAHHGQLWLRVV
jgi:hypothetical protein